MLAIEPKFESPNETVFDTRSTVPGDVALATDLYTARRQVSWSQKCRL